MKNNFKGVGWGVGLLIKKNARQKIFSFLITFAASHTHN